MTDLIAAGPSGFRPSHPGAILRDDVLPALNLSVMSAAKILGISRQTLHTVLSERAAVTPGMALRIGKLCGNGAHIWLAMQQARDLWDAEQILGDKIQHIPTMRAG